jgi:hypothetical protein
VGVIEAAGTGHNCLADVDHEMHVIGNSLDRQIDNIDGRAPFILAQPSNTAVDLEVLAACLDEAFQIVVKKFTDRRSFAPCHYSTNHERPPPEDAAKHRQFRRHPTWRGTALQQHINESSLSQQTVVRADVQPR